jgi:F1F0 ATPase subunit 2
MNNSIMLLLAWLAGVVLGAIFFGGLWWTVRLGLSSRRPALWFITSSLLRTGVALAGFYFVSNGDWKRLLLCFLGFFMTRPLVTWLTRSPRPSKIRPVQEASHAP